MDKFDICFISPTLLEAGTKRGGGIEEIDYQVAIQLSKSSNVIILGPFYQKYERTKYINDRCRIEQVPISAVKNNPPKYRLERLKRFFLMPIYSSLIAMKIFEFKKRKLKLIIVHNGLPGITASILAKILKINVIFSEGNTSPWINPYITPSSNNTLNLISNYMDLKIGKTICKLSNCIRTQSNSIKIGMISHGIDEKKIEVISGGVDLDMFETSSRLDSKSFKVGFIGRLTEIKGVKLLLEVIKLAKLEKHNIRFVIIGDGPYKEEFLKLDNVEHVGFISRSDLPKMLLDIQVVLFFQKELGLAELEAMAAGKVLIACNSGEIPQKLKHLKDSILCSPDAYSYVRAIELLYNNPSLVDELSNKSIKNAKNNYDWNVLGKKWLRICSGYLDYDK